AGARDRGRIVDVESTREPSLFQDSAGLWVYRSKDSAVLDEIQDISIEQRRRHVREKLLHAPDDVPAAREIAASTVFDSQQRVQRRAARPVEIPISFIN